MASNRFPTLNPSKRSINMEGMMGRKTLHKLVVLVAASWVRWVVGEEEDRRSSRWQKINLHFEGLNGDSG